MTKSNYLTLKKNQIPSRSTSQQTTTSHKHTHHIISDLKVGLALAAQRTRESIPIISNKNIQQQSNASKVTKKKSKHISERSKSQDTWNTPKFIEQFTSKTRQTRSTEAAVATEAVNTTESFLPSLSPKRKAADAELGMGASEQQQQPTKKVIVIAVSDDEGDVFEVQDTTPRKIQTPVRVALPTNSITSKVQSTTPYSGPQGHDTGSAALLHQELTSSYQALATFDAYFSSLAVQPVLLTSRTGAALDPMNVGSGTHATEIHSATSSDATKITFQYPSITQVKNPLKRSADAQKLEGEPPKTRARTSCQPKATYNAQPVAITAATPVMVDSANVSIVVAPSSSFTDAPQPLPTAGSNALTSTSSHPEIIDLTEDVIIDLSTDVVLDLKVKKTVVDTTTANKVDFVQAREASRELKAAKIEPVNVDIPIVADATTNAAAPPSSSASNTASCPMTDAPEASYASSSSSANAHVQSPPAFEDATLPGFMVGKIVDNELELLQLLGEGGYGHVYLGQYLKSNSRVAVKVLRKSRSRCHLQLLQLEMDIQASLAHPNLLALHRVTEDDTYFYMIMDLCDQGDLFDYVERRQHVVTITEEHIVKKWFCQILDGVESMHANGVYHRDLKLENILLKSEREQDVTCKVADFGFATRQRYSLEFGCGTHPYLAPEHLDGDKQAFPYDTAASDSWSLGLLLLELMFGRIPWQEASSKDPNYSMYKRFPFTLKKVIYPRLSTAMLQLLESVLVTDDAERPSVSEIKQKFLAVDHLYAQDGDDYYSDDSKKESPVSSPIATTKDSDIVGFSWPGGIEEDKEAALNKSLHFECKRKQQQHYAQYDDPYADRLYYGLSRHATGPTAFHQDPAPLHQDTTSSNQDVKLSYPSHDTRNP